MPNDDQLLDNWIDEHFDEQLQFLQELIRVPTDTPPGNNAPHAERTAELAAANKRLEESVRFIRKANGEHQALFLESQMIQRKLSQQARHIVSAQDEVATRGASLPLS